MAKTRYALIGAGSRAEMYLTAIAGDYADKAELVAIGDTNPGRIKWSLEHNPGLNQKPVIFEPQDLATAIRQSKADKCIVTTPDYLHADYISAALDAGVDVIVEKPLTTTEEGVQKIADAVDRTGHSVRITFNYRYSPRNEELKKVIDSGAIGDPLSVHFEWVLDTAHGADYFRRWHRYKQFSGGLQIHKASHHFDLVNWWVDGLPKRVFASGALKFYGRENAEKMGLTPRPERGTTDSPLRDKWCLDMRINDPMWRGLYLEQEQYDGYLRDRDVFDEGITIEDNLAVMVDYYNGVSMSYSLNAHCPWEGYNVAINGTLGRAELHVVERGSTLVDENGNTVIDPSARPDLIASDASRPVGEHLIVQNHFQSAYEVPINTGTGAHGGGDHRLVRDVFDPDPNDASGKVADWVDGVRSVCVGLSINKSLETGQAIWTKDLQLGSANNRLGLV